jgi:hypothetical protein
MVKMDKEKITNIFLIIVLIIAIVSIIYLVNIQKIHGYLLKEHNETFECSEWCNAGLFSDLCIEEIKQPNKDLEYYMCCCGIKIRD